jgi:ElaB/YqjD/DUF883 family membrane-anchored ribosome-binding protein
MAGGVVGAVKEKAQNLTSGATEVAGQVRDTARDWAGSAASAAGQAWDSTREEMSELASRAGDVYGNFDSFIRRHPLPSLLIALGVGFAVGSCLTGTRRRSW